MNLSCTDFDRRFLAEVKRQNEAVTIIDVDELKELRRKSNLYDIISVATPTQFTQIWDRMVSGESFDRVVEELGQVQTEWEISRRERA